jgi:hypothetical protein
MAGKNEEGRDEGRSYEYQGEDQVGPGIFASQSGSGPLDRTTAAIIAGQRLRRGAPKHTARLTLDRLGDRFATAGGRRPGVRTGPAAGASRSTYRWSGREPVAACAQTRAAAAGSPLTAAIGVGEGGAALLRRGAVAFTWGLWRVR